MRIRLVIDEATRPPLLDIALGPALLATVTQSGGPDVLRVYRPAPTLAFSGRDCNSPAIADAAAAAARHGFEPVRRAPGGRAAAYHRGAICLDHASAEPMSPHGISERFAFYGALVADALRGLGAPAEVGEVPGEYCPGRYSVNDGAGHKLVGAAQRLTGGGWLFSTVILVSDPEPIRGVLEAVYAALGLAWDPGTVGAVAGVAQGVSIGEVRDAVLAEYARHAELVPAELPASTLALAAARRERHRVAGVTRVSHGSTRVDTGSHPGESPGGHTVGRR